MALFARVRPVVMAVGGEMQPVRVGPEEAAEMGGEIQAHAAGSSE